MKPIRTTLAALAAAAVMTGFTPGAAEAAKQKVKVVFIGPLTGGTSANGLGGRNSADLAVAPEGGMGMVVPDGRLTSVETTGASGLSYVYVPRVSDCGHGAPSGEIGSNLTSSFVKRDWR